MKAAWLLLLLVAAIANCGHPVAAHDETFGAASIVDKGSEDTPNIIVFLVDDLGWQDTSVAFDDKPSLFQSHFRTPHLKRIADRGIRFGNAYAHCVCSPTRSSIMLGQNPARHRVTNWTLYPDRETSGKTPRLGPPTDWRQSGIQPDTLTLPEILQSGGYFTIHCGKAHWGAVGTEGSDPTKLGFDINIAGHAAGAPGSYQAKDNFGNNTDGSRKMPWGVPGLEKYYGTDKHLTDVLAIEACAAIETARQTDKPFFLYMAPYAVHTPIQPHPRFLKNYQSKTYPGTEIKIPKVEAEYASMVEGYDDALGQIMQKLNSLNIADKTIILFTSDNGGLSAHARSTTPYGTGKDTHCYPLKAGKGSAYEGGTRVPMVVSWVTPDSGSAMQKKIPITRNSISAAHVISEDILPTVCNWASVAVTETQVLDGQDFTDQLSLEEKKTERETSKVDLPRSLLFHYPHVWGPQGEGYQPHSALRLGKWKVIYFYQDQRWELYDLQADIGEANDLATAEPKQLEEMQGRLLIELKNRAAQYPTNLKSSKPEKPQVR